MSPDPVRAKIQTQGLRFCPNLECGVVVYLVAHSTAARGCPGCRNVGIPCSSVIGLVERRPIPVEPTRYREDGEPTI